MNRSLICLVLGLIILISGGQSVFSQENHLEKSIQLQTHELALADALFVLGEAGGFQISYNSGILDGDRQVRINATGESVETILLNLLGRDYRYSVIGDHLVILPRKQEPRPKKEERKQQYQITGYIYNRNTGERIYEASVYELKARRVAATNQDGFYNMSLPALPGEVYLNYSKLGYQDTVIIIRPVDDVRLNITVTPRPNTLAEMNKVQNTGFTIDQTPFVAALVPQRAVAMADNVPIIEERPFQVSFLPFLGSNRFVSGMLTNRFSLNVLAGYSGGVDGVELGGLVNMVRGDMKGAQIAGFGNIVGGQTDGIQVGGFFNVTAKKMLGSQTAGFANVALDSLSGVQIAGFANFLKGRMGGPQISGFANLTTRDVDGFQVSGFSNVAVGDVKLGQVSGFANYGRNVGGVQVAGFSNIASGQNRALQLAGFLNYATDLHGVQIAPFNVADTVSAGVPIGVFSFVRKGFHPLEIASEELFWANLSFKTGINGFYNIFGAGINASWLYAGYGFGSQVYWGKRFATGLELQVRGLVDRETNLDFMGVMTRLNLTFNYRVSRFLAFTMGPSANVLVSTHDIPTSGDFLLPALIPVSAYPFDQATLRYWLGWTVGIRL